MERQPEVLLAAAQGRLHVGDARDGVPREVLQGAHGDDIGPFEQRGPVVNRRDVHRISSSREARVVDAG
ncbi:hypothetical protein ACFYV5_04430 [Streptomyces sp. NPDC003035]|uniref:hypothetical protein n=1 Tax=Streptomyces sp. NPDC003035 TaxID=3364676 RepID=UPI0036CD9533